MVIIHKYDKYKWSGEFPSMISKLKGGQNGEGFSFYHGTSVVVAGYPRLCYRCYEMSKDVY